MPSVLWSKRAHFLQGTGEGRSADTRLCTTLLTCCLQSCERVCKWWKRRKRVASHFVHIVELLSSKAALDVCRALWLLLGSSWAIAWLGMHSHCLERRHRFPLFIDHFTGNRIQPQDLMYCVIRTSANKSFYLLEKYSQAVFHMWIIPSPFSDSWEKS